MGGQDPGADRGQHRGGDRPALRELCEPLDRSAWLCAIGYAYQLYFDFWGYSTMAVGLGYLFGLRLPQNFNSPYKATDISNFWERWHLSLSTVLRDYLHNPIAFWITRKRASKGKSVGRVARVPADGVSILEAVVRPMAEAVAAGDHVRAGGIRVDLLRCETFGMAATIIGKMFSWQMGASPTGLHGMAVILPIAAWWAHIGPNVFEMSHDWRGWRLSGAATLFLLAMVSITAGDESPFLYFQF